MVVLNYFFVYSTYATNCIKFKANCKAVVKINDRDPIADLFSNGDRDRDRDLNF